MKMVHDALDLYREVYEELLAVPVVQGEKSENEKFAGAVKTTTVETFIAGNGRAVQGATSHYLGDHFSKMFNIQYEDKDTKLKHALQTSWGLTTRTIGVMIMTHADDKGLVFPPRVAETQIVIVTIPPVKGDRDAIWANILQLANQLKTALEHIDLRVTLDDRTDKTPGYKYNHWELQGVPLRVEIGAKDLENRQLTTVRRDTNAKASVSLHSPAQAAAELHATLDLIQKEMLQRATQTLKDNIQIVRKWDEVIPALRARKLVLAPWCEDKETEDEIKKKTRAEFEEDEKATGMSGAMKTLCLPLERSGYQLPIENETCFFTGKPAKRWTLWGRSY
jgi:prolyl-tRNA synthetase